MFFRFRSVNPSVRRARLITWAFISVSLLVGAGAYFHFRSRAASTTVTNDAPSFAADLKNTLDLQAGVGKPTFTRATTATVTDFEGLIKNVKSGEARFEGARRVENLIPNSSFKSWTAGVPDGWLIDAANVTVTQVTGWDGTDSAVRFTSTLSGDISTNRLKTSTSVFVNNGAPIGTQLRRVTARVRRVSGSGGLGCVGNSWDGSVNGHGFFAPPSNNVWYRTDFGGLFSNANLTTTTALKFFLFTANDTFEIDDVQLEDVTGQANQNPSEYVSTNVLTSAPYHGANVDGVKYFTTQNGNTVAGSVVTEATGAAIPDATLHGYVAEGQRTNLQAHSVNDGAHWSAGTGALTVNATLSPDGTITGSKFADDSTNGTHLLWKTGGSSIVSGTTYTSSIYLKQGTMRYMRVAFSTSDDVSQARVDVDLQTGTLANGSAIGTGTYVSSAITSVGNGWYRVSITGSISAAGGYIFVYGSSTMGTISYAGSGSYYYFWGAQLEAATFASSYIPTVASAVTRNADVLTYPSSGNVNGTKGSSYLESKSFNIANGTRFIGIDDNSGSKNYRSLSEITCPSTCQLGFYDGTPDKALGVISSSATMQKLATSWTGTRAAGAVNGVLTAGVFDGDMNSAANLTLGGYNFGGVTINLFGTIRNVKIWKKALSDGQLTNMTSATDAVSRDAVSKTTVNASQSAQMTQGLAGFWSFNGADMSGATALDRSGNNRSGTLANGPARTVGKVGQALHFDGTNDYAGVSSGLGSPNTLSISLWFRTRGSNAPILGQSDASPATAATSYAPPLSVTSSGFLRGEFWTGSVAGITSSTAVNDGAWHHAVLIGNANTQSLYLDNTLVGSRSGTISQAWWAYTTMGAAYDDGTRFASGTGWKYFSGDIDEVRVYGRALSSDEVRQLYNLGR